MRRFRAGMGDSPWPLSLAAAVSLSLTSPWLFGLFDGTRDLISFRDRAIGLTTLQGLDASGYARNYVLMTSLFALCFFAAFLLFAWLDRALRRHAEPLLVAKEYRGIERLAEISIVLAVMRLIFRDDFLTTLGNVVYFVVALIFLLILVKGRAFSKHGSDRAFFTLLANHRLLIVLALVPLPLPFVFWVLAEQPVGFSGLPMAAWLSMWSGAFALLVAGCRAWRPSAEGLILASIPVLVIPFSIPLANELQYSFPHLTARVVSLWGMAGLALASGALFVAHRRGLLRPTAPVLVDFVCFPLFVATAALLKVHRHTIDVGHLDYFHTGEVTVPAQQFFNFASIPLIDLRLAHTLSDFFYPALYSAVNGVHGLDMLIWKRWLPEVVTAVLVYFFLARLASPAFALLATSLAPVMGAVTPYYAFALVPPLLLCAAVRRPTLWRFVLVWASAVGLALWRFDFGMVGFLALALLLGVYLVRRPGRFRTVVAALVVVAAAGLAALFLLAFLSERAAFESLVFLVKSYAFRLATRTRAELFEQYSTVAVVQYYLLPAASLVAVLYFAVRRLALGRYLVPGKYMVVFLAIFSLVISLRSLERHSLIEGFNPYLFVFLTACLPFLFRAAGREGPASRATFLAVLVLNAFFWLPPSSYSAGTMFQLFSPGELFELRDWTSGEQRVFYESERHDDLVRFLTEKLEGDQTFFDATNSPLLYVLADKRFPTHVIPNIVHTSETVQALVLADLEGLRRQGRLPFVIFKQGNEYWDNVDHVANEVRSYRVTEYVYRHYRPFVSIGRYQVWIEASFEDPGSLLADYTTRHLLETAPSPKTERLVVLPGEEMSFRAEEGDAHVSSLLRLDALPPLDAYPYWHFRLRYRSSAVGRLQVFYRADLDEFAEGTSVWAELVATGPEGFDEVHLPLRLGSDARRLADMRFDPPAGVDVTFLEAELVAGDLDWRPVSRAELSQSFELGELARLWGTYDPLQAVSRTDVVSVLGGDPTFLDDGQEIVFALAEHSSEKAGYLHLRLQPAEPRLGDAGPKMFIEYGDRLVGSFEIALRGAEPEDFEVRELSLANAPKTHHAESLPFAERTVYQATGADPYVHQVLDLSDPIVAAAGTRPFLVLRYRSSTDGELEVFFATDGNWFLTSDSVTVRIARTSEDGEPLAVLVPLAVDARRLSDVRFDFPVGNFFEIVEVDFVQQKVDDAHYLVRLATQWAWASQDVREITLRASGPVTLAEAALRKGD